MKIDVYGTTICPHCKDVVKYLAENNLRYNYKLVPEDISPLDLGRLVDRVVRTVPVIVVDGKENTLKELKEQVSQKFTSFEILSESLEYLEL